MKITVFFIGMLMLLLFNFLTFGKEKKKKVIEVSKLIRKLVLCLAPSGAHQWGAITHSP